MLTGLGRPTLVERAQRLERIATEEGVSALLPGAPPDPWRFDPIPVLLPQADFARLRPAWPSAPACWMPCWRTCMARSVCSPRACCHRPWSTAIPASSAPAATRVMTYPERCVPMRCLRRQRAARANRGLLQFYAADLVRGPDGEWRVLADRTGWPNGLAHALENRRRLGRILPEIFASHLLCPLEHFAELWQDALHRLVPHADGDPGGVALLTPGHGDSDWFGHVLLARELNCALVECGDLTVRGGRLFLKTLRGLQPIGVLLRGEHGNAHRSAGAGARCRRRVPVCWKRRATAACASSTTPAPALSKPRLWPLSSRAGPARAGRGPGAAGGGDPLAGRLGARGGAAMRDAVLRDPDAWLVRSALDGAAPPLGSRRDGAGASATGAAGSASPPRPRNSWRARPVSASAAPCLDGGQLVPRPLVIRLFLA